MSRAASALFHAHYALRTDSRNDACLVDGHPCMTAIQPSAVIDWLNLQLN